MAEVGEVATSIAFVIYDATTGVVRTALTAVHHDGDTVVANNTPDGCAALVVDAGSPVLVDQKGWVVQDGTLVQVPPSPAELLAAAQKTQSAAIEAAYQNATFATAISYMGTTFWTDANSQSLIMGATVGYGLEGGVPDGFMFWDSTNIGVPMALADLQGLYAAVMTRVNTNFVKRKTLLSTIAAATDVAAVQAVVWG